MLLEIMSHKIAVNFCFGKNKIPWMKFVGSLAFVTAEFNCNVYKDSCEGIMVNFEVRDINSLCSDNGMDYGAC